MDEQQPSLPANVERGDFTLISNPSDHPIGPQELQGGNFQLVLVHEVRRDSETGLPVEILVRGLHRLEPYDWMFTMRHGPPIATWFWDYHTHYLPAMDLTKLFTLRSQVTVRPTRDAIRNALFAGKCAYASCDNGLVIISTYTKRMLRGVFPLTERPHDGMRTICPFCTGVEYYTSHERQVQSWNDTGRTHYIGVAHYTSHEQQVQSRNDTGRTHYNGVALQHHITRLNERRQTMGYEPLAALTALPDLTTVSQYTIRQANEEAALALATTIDYSDPSFIQSASSSSESLVQPESASRDQTALPQERPILAPGPVRPRVRSRDWYARATTHIMNDHCGICLEAFKPGEMIADLPCWHFYHAACWEHVERKLCPMGCNSDREEASNEQ